ncbi:MAG TPA: enolase C-terminal domain-like protein, partial [Candidatus Limnocylindria bacterium]|nr:enolase C-terminal domain-like protein [Candidatus Limnocylindria bacterium]
MTFASLTLESVDVRPVVVPNELDTPVQLGENFYGPRDLFQALELRAGDYMMPDLMRIGGVSGWLRAV